MSLEESLAILVDKIEELASNLEDKFTHASSDFEVTTWDVNRLRVALLEVKSEISKPDSKIHDTNEPGCNELRILTKSFRPLLEDLEKLVMKDQGLKKKRIWRRDKDNAAALDRIHRQLELRTPMLGFYISTMKHSQLAQFQEKLGIAMVELDRRDSLGRSGQIDGEWDYNQWPVHEQLMVLRRELAEIGITDIDIEAHKSSIKALLRERLPSYHEAQSGLNHTEPSEVSLDAALLRTSEPEHHTRTRRVSGAQEPNVNEDPARSTFGPDIAAPSSPRNESEGMFYINDSTDSESEILQDNEARDGPQSPGPHINAKMKSKPSHSQRPSIRHPCLLCQLVFTSGHKLERHENEMHPRGLIWSCAEIKTYEAAYVNFNFSALATVCGFCGRTFPSSVDRRSHLYGAHDWTGCSREMQFYRADQFRQHLKLSHSADLGWWLEELLRSVRRRHPGSKRHSLSHRRSGSLSYKPSLDSLREDQDPHHEDILPTSPSSMSRTGSMHRIHSDVSEYDAQGNLTRRTRTTTTSYSSLPEAAAVPLQRHESHPGPQPRLPSESPETDPAFRTRHITFPLTVPNAQTKRDLFCPFCPKYPKFDTIESVAVHLRMSHSDRVADPRRAQQHRKLKQAYKKRNRQLYKALQALRQIGTQKTGSDAVDPRITDFVTETLRELDLDTQPRSYVDANGSEHISIISSESDGDGEDWEADISGSNLHKPAKEGPQHLSGHGQKG